MAIDLGNTPTGTPPTAGEKLQIRSAIGLGTTDAPTFLAQTLTGQSLTGTQATSLVDLSATWNTTGTPSALKLNVTDTASNAASKLMDIQRNGVSQFQIIKNTAAYSVAEYDGNVVTGYYIGSRSYWNAKIAAMVMGSQGSYNWSANGVPNPNSDTIGLSLFQDAPGILAQRNGTSTQQFRVYNTISGVSGVDYERGFMRYATGLLEIGYEFGGLGGSRSVQITTPGDVYLNGTGTGSAVGFKTNGVLRAYFDNGGKLLFNLDNTYDIGASGANRPRTIYAGTSIVSPAGTFGATGGVIINNYVNIAGGNFVNWLTRSSITSLADGNLTLSNQANNSFGLLQLGGITSAFPAIKRNGTGIDIRLADDSAFAPVKGKITTDTAYTATTVVATGYITLYDSTGTAYRVPCAV